MVQCETRVPHLPERARCRSGVRRVARAEKVHNVTGKLQTLTFVPELVKTILC